MMQKCATTLFETLLLHHKIHNTSTLSPPPPPKKTKLYFVIVLILFVRVFLLKKRLIESPAHIFRYIIIHTTRMSSLACAPFISLFQQPLPEGVLLNIVELELQLCHFNVRRSGVGGEGGGGTTTVGDY